MMSEKKARIEPEVNFPDPESGSAPDLTGGRGARADRQQGIEALMAGLDEIDGGEDEGAEGDPMAERIVALEAETTDLRDRWTRALAETENVRRRAERDRRDAEAYAGTRLARDMLTVWDNLERAVQAADDALKAEHGAFLQGVELTQRELLNAFGKHRIEKVTPTRGEKFDPNRHQAMFEAPVPGAEPGTVIEVLQDGFKIADRLLRPAMVGVARAAPEAPAAQSQDDGAQAAEAQAAEGQDGGQPT